MGHGNTAPELPEIKDEAADSPRWLPALGLGLFAAFLIWVIFVREHASEFRSRASTSTPTSDESAEAAP